MIFLNPIYLSLLIFFLDKFINFKNFKKLFLNFEYFELKKPERDELTMHY